MFFKNQFISNLKYSFFEIRKNLDNCKKKSLKRTAFLCRGKPVETKYNPKFGQWYSYFLDIIDTKIFEASHESNNKNLW